MRRRAVKLYNVYNAQGNLAATVPGPELDQWMKKNGRQGMRVVEVKKDPAMRRWQDNLK